MVEKFSIDFIINEVVYDFAVQVTTDGIIKWRNLFYKKELILILLISFYYFTQRLKDLTKFSFLK